MSFASMSSLSTSTGPRLSPKSPPPGLVDFYGKRKQILKIQVLEREIALLQEELKSLEGLHPASSCCKELDTVLGSSSDPFTPRIHTISRCHRFWKQIRLKLLFLLSLPWVCCTSCCLIPKKMVKGRDCCSSSSSKCPGSSCCLKTKTAQNCCNVLKILATPCAHCLVFFSCKCRVGLCDSCCHSCCHQ